MMSTTTTAQYTPPTPTRLSSTVDDEDKDDDDDVEVVRRAAEVASNGGSKARAVPRRTAHLVSLGASHLRGLATSKWLYTTVILPSYTVLQRQQQRSYGTSERVYIEQDCSRFTVKKSSLI